ncbi:MAG: PAS domain-containing hybrid sensor histidine kinase/response regulator, partial [Proteobacteria bacterium]
MRHIEDIRQEAKRFSAYKLFTSLAASAGLVASFEIIATLTQQPRNPGPALLISVVSSTFFGGIGVGAVITIASTAYFAVFLSDAGRIFHYSAESGWRLGLTAVAFSVTTALLGLLKFRLDNARRSQRKTIAELIESRADLSRRVEQRARELSSLLEVLPQIVWKTKLDGSNEYVNKKWLDYTGLSRAQITREGWSTLFDPSEVAETTEIWKVAAESKSPFSHELRIRRADGSYRWHLCRAFPILDANGHISEWFGTHTDIEEQKQLQNELLRAKQEAEEVSQMKSAFLATVSHEIRTPLSAIIGFSRLLVEETWSEEKMKEFAQISLRNGYALSRIIDDILDLSKVEAGKLEIAKTEVSLQELLSEVVESLSVKAMEKGIGVSYRIEDTVPETFLSDAVRLRQILINIIGNAIKFT